MWRLRHHGIKTRHTHICFITYPPYLIYDNEGDVKRVPHTTKSKRGAFFVDASSAVPPYHAPPRKNNNYILQLTCAVSPPTTNKNVAAVRYRHYKFNETPSGRKTSLQYALGLPLHTSQCSKPTRTKKYSSLAACAVLL